MFGPISEQRKQNVEETQQMGGAVLGKDTVVFVGRLHRAWGGGSAASRCLTVVTAALRVSVCVSHHFVTVTNASDKSV